MKNIELRALIAAPDPRYNVLGRTLTNKHPDVLMAELECNIQQHLLAAQRISMCVDVWSKKGLTSSYMGTMAHFVGPRTTSGIM